MWLPNHNSFFAENLLWQNFENILQINMPRKYFLPGLSSENSLRQNLTHGQSIPLNVRSSFYVSNIPVRSRQQSTTRLTERWLPAFSRILCEGSIPSLIGKIRKSTHLQEHLTGNRTFGAPLPPVVIFLVKFPQQHQRHFCLSLPNLKY